jgi:pimeloyl-ACP methyl ester carboxylesterase
MRISSFVLLALAALIDPARISKQMEHQQPSALVWTPVTWTTDAGEVTEAERAVISVPERHGNPSGPQIQLPLVRFRSKAAKPSAPIIYLAGGPGGSGITSAKRDQYFPAAMALREVGDVIFFDQRGTGAAEPSLAVDLRFDVPSDEPIASDKSRQLFRATAESAAKVVRSREIDLDAYNTQENADDIESIRIALGSDKINLWGHSYGSHLGLTYIKRHGAHAGRAIFGGINGLDQRWRYPSEAEAWLRAVDSATRMDPRLEAVMPDFLGTARRTIAKLAANPARVTVNGQTVHIGADEVRTLIVLQAGESDFVKRLPLIISNLDKADVAQYAPVVRAILRNRPLGTTMSYAMHIASGVSPRQLERISREAPSSILADAINYPFSDAGFRTAWGVNDLGEKFRSPVVSSVPTLFISGTIDGRTSLAAANEVRKGFRNNTQVIVRGAAHDIYGETPQLIDLMRRFMLGERLRNTTLTVPVEFHGPDEPALTDELHKVALSRGAEGAVARAKELRNTQGKDLTSYVMENVAGMLDRTDKRPADAIAVLKAATEMFPNNAVLHLRLGGALLASGDSASAAAAYRKAVSLNPLLRFGAVQLSKIEGGAR